jgi:hypothetical protein
VDAFCVGSRLFVRNRPNDGDDEELLRIEQAIEEDCLFPLLKGKDVGRWVAAPSCCVVLPHDPDHPVEPIAFSKLPKRTREYLNVFRDKLAGRRKFRNFDPSGSHWHGLYSVLDATFVTHKVIWREMADGAISAAVSSAKLPSGEIKPIIPDHKLFLVPCGSQAEAEFVCGVFNSTISGYLIKSYALATGISTHVLDRLPVPRFDRAETSHLEVAAKARKCASLAASGRSGELHAAENDLDVAGAHVLKISQELDVIRSAMERLSE